MPGTERKYTNGEITVFWQADLCVHCQECVRGLPQVFNLDARPWVAINAAPSGDIVEQVKACPSGALSLI